MEAMYKDARAFIETMGGYKALASRLGIGATTLHTHMMSGLLPPKWYGALVDLANEKRFEPPNRSLFAFEELLPPVVSEQSGDTA